MGSANAPFSLRAGASQTMVVAVSAISPISATIRPRFICSDQTSASYDAATIDGLDTIQFSASAAQTPDVIALSATTSNDGILHIQGNSAGAFAVAVDNVGSASAIIATVDTGLVELPLQATICQTDVNGQCLQTSAASATLSLAANATATFGVFIQATGELPFRPDAFRVSVRFSDITGVSRGGTSVAVTNVPALATSQPVGGIYATETPYFDISSNTYASTVGLLFVGEDGELQALNDLGNQSAGTLKIAPDLSMSAITSDDYVTEQGFLPVGGGKSVLWSGALSQTGALYAQRQLATSLGSTPTLANDSQQLFAQFSATAYDRPSSFGQVAGTWNVRDNTNALVGSVFVGQTGSYSGTISGCTVTGNIGLINSQYDMYKMSIAVAGCTLSPGAASGLTGLAILTDDQALNDTLFFIGNNLAASYNSFQTFTRN
jgi:hypothetical protein